MNNKKFLTNWQLALSAVVLAASVLGSAAFSPAAFAGDLEWSGLYRIEGYALNGMLLDSNASKRKEYGVHTLILRPKIVAADGLYINAQLNVFNDPTGSGGGNQLGAYWGNGVGDVGGTNAQDTNAASENERDEQIAVSQFNVTLVQEFGSLLAGRAPLEFGLGLTYSGGRGLFDHYADTRDLVAYKMVLGNFYFTPMIATIDESAGTGTTSLAAYDDVRETNFELKYENPEADVEMGVFYANRVAAGGNDFPTAPIGGASVAGELNTKNFNIYYLKNTTKYRVGFEVAQQGGSSGIYNLSGENISFTGFGLLGEFDYRPEAGAWKWGAKFGYATGDDPSTGDEYEGFYFDRNYDVGMMMFNHAMGRADFLKTALLGRTFGAGDVTDRPDIEAISNTMFLSPYVTYKWSDKFNIVTQLTWAQLDNDEIDIDGAGTIAKVGTDLGYELDVTLEYKPSESVTWLNSIGYFSPGSAWEGDGAFASPDSAIGFVSRAAVSF